MKQIIKNYEKFKSGNIIAYQFELKNYLVTYIDGKDQYRVINYDTNKEGIIKLSKKNRNIDYVKNEMNFIAGNNNLKVSRVTILDKLN